VRRLFLFRPEPGARHSADRARDMGLDVTVVPLFEIETLPWTAPDPHEFDAILFTSANAVRFAGDQVERLRGLPVHCVGEATARAAEVAGFGVASAGEGGVDDLLEHIEPGARLLHLCGEDRRSPESPVQSLTCQTVYRATPVPRPRGLDRLPGQVAALHSPRAAARLAELVGPEVRRTVAIVAISEATARSASHGWEQLLVAAAPSDSALLALAARLCQD